MGGIRQLANELQLSIGTVSRALNDRPDVNPETRARVKAAAARSGYVPNQSGRSLRSGRTGMVAAVIPTRAPSADSGLLTVLEGARRTLRGHALDLIVLFRGPEEDPLESLQRIVQRRIADSVIISETTARDPRLAYLQAAGVEYVAFGRSAGMEDYPFVDFDVEAMAAEAARLFVRDGHRRFALVTSAELMNYEELTLRAFVDEVVRLGLPREAVRTIGMSRAGTSPRPTSGASPKPTARRRSSPRTRASPPASTSTSPRSASRSAATSRSSAPSPPSTPAASSRRSRTSRPTSTPSASRSPRHLVARLPDSTEAPPASTLVPLRFAPRASHGRR